MKKILIIGFFLLMPHICTASDSDSENNEESELSKTHRFAGIIGKKIIEEQEIEKEAKEEAVIRGRGLFYPNKYDTYQDFKQARLISLLTDRLGILCKFKRLGSNWSEPERLYHKMCLDRNEILLMNNLDEGGIGSIFGETYDRQAIQSSHIINVATYLKSRFPDDESTQKELDKLISHFSSNLEQQHCALHQPQPNQAGGQEATSPPKATKQDELKEPESEIPSVAPVASDPVSQEGLTQQQIVIGEILANSKLIQGIVEYLELSSGLSRDLDFYNNFLIKSQTLMIMFREKLEAIPEEKRANANNDIKLTNLELKTIEELKSAAKSQGYNTSSLLEILKDMSNRKWTSPIMIGRCLEAYGSLKERTHERIKRTAELYQRLCGRSHPFIDIPEMNPPVVPTAASRYSQDEPPEQQPHIGELLYNNQRMIDILKYKALEDPIIRYANTIRQCLQEEDSEPKDEAAPGKEQIRAENGAQIALGHARQIATTNEKSSSSEALGELLPERTLMRYKDITNIIKGCASDVATVATYSRAIGLEPYMLEHLDTSTDPRWQASPAGAYLMDNIALSYGVIDFYLEDHNTHPDTPPTSAKIEAGKAHTRPRPTGGKKVAPHTRPAYPTQALRNIWKTWIQTVNELHIQLSGRPHPSHQWIITPQQGREGTPG
jgi:hypothetical protein